MTASALSMYSIGLVAYGLRDIINKVFYSLQDTKTPMINGAIAMGLNIVLNIIFVKFMGHAGLALATSLSALICTFLLFYSLRKKIGNFGQEKILITAIKSLLSEIYYKLYGNRVYRTSYFYIWVSISGDNSIWNICDNS